MHLQVIDLMSSVPRPRKCNLNCAAWGWLMAASVSLSSQVGWNGGWLKQRAASRTLVVLSATVHFQGKGHVGLIRDISRDGLFVYSDFMPKLGDSIRVEIKDRGNGTSRVLCCGAVVRVESKAAGSAIGIAVQITTYGL